MDIEEAVKKSLKDSSTIFYHWSEVQTKFLGCLCQIFWPGDDCWYYARILNIDFEKSSYYVWYIMDQVTEWIDINTEAVIVAEEEVLAQIKGSPAWPAQKYWMNSNAITAISHKKGYTDQSITHNSIIDPIKLNAK